MNTIDDNQDTPSQSPLATALGIVLDEDNAKTEQEKKRAIAATQTDADRANTDANFAREILYDVEVKSAEAVEQLLQIAQESMSARHYEVLAQLLSHRGANAERYLKIHADKQKVQNNAINLVRNEMSAPNALPASNVTNIVNIDKAVFTGTTAELLELVRTASPAQLLDQTGLDAEVDE
jgi:hypothetical protein